MLVAAAEASTAAQPRRRCGSSSAPGIVSLIGPNGAGKTNFLEALYFALTGRSFRTGDRRDLIPFGGPLARAEARVRGEDGIERPLLASVSRAEGRRHLLDGNPADPATLARHRPPVARLLARPAGAGQGPAGASAAPTSTASSPPAGPRARSCASATARRWPSATRWSPGSPAGAARRASSTPGTPRSPRPRRR